MEILVNLEYSYDVLEPWIDAKTMEIHHSKHHQGYVDKFNKAIEGTELEAFSVEEILKDVSKIPEEIKSAVINNGGGVFNHNFFWKILGPNSDNIPDGKIADAIEDKFDSFEEFKKQFSEAGLTQFGSGWVWLVVDNGELGIVKTSNQDSPISQGKTPILCLDVWEHAYYLKYQNKRQEYIDAFWNVINWNKVNEIYETSLN
jgi:superoxide dismutase, Fe-Mn family